MSSFENLAALEILRDMALRIQAETMQTPRFAYAGEAAWAKIIAEVNEYSGAHFSALSGAAPLQYLGIRVTLDSSLPPGTLLVGLEQNLQPAIEDGS